MSDGTKAIPKVRLRAIMEYPCDGIPRFEVRGSVLAFKVPYSTAYGEVFRLAGGTTVPGMAGDSRPRRVFSKEAIRRVTALNRLYTSQAAKWLLSYAESQRAARDLLPQRVASEVAKATENVTIPP